MPRSRRSRHSRRPSWPLRSAPSGLSGTTAVSDGSRSGPSSGPSTAFSRISPSRIIHDGPPRSRSPSSGPSTAFSCISSSQTIDDSPPPSYRSPSSSASPSTAIGGGPAAPSVTGGSRVIRHMSDQDRPFRRLPGERRNGTSRRSRNQPAVPSGRAPSHRAFRPATVAPSVYIGQGGRNPATTVAPRDSASQVPTRIEIRYEPRNRRVRIEHGRHESPSVVQVSLEGHEYDPLTFPRVTDRGDAQRILTQFDERFNSFYDEMNHARYVVLHAGGSEFPRALAEDMAAKHYRVLRAQLERDFFYIYHQSLLPASQSSPEQSSGAW
ncbi:hypothetical protein FPOAC2_10092 [Fusarium poae]|uniref:Uncharacterized protein n=1 Tax=Fusarium poae TaxID=36050 RepID=A0A1B8ARG3_FUSPO|nr:hypothetical protein FPOAC1_007505 [Fusarium poae]KAG8668136.1 hypothetical protein FPOAC1_007505 [Fusarium poae]OBS22931.1 hypothetical protein FPOA_09252 [Fusarium poae]